MGEQMTKKLFFVASEAQPFFASGGLGDVIGSLPKRIQKNAKEKLEVSVILPLYANLNKAYKNKLVYIGQTNTKLSWRNQYCGIFKYEEGGVKYYFIDNEYYFKRENFYGYFDDAERFAFFSRAAIDVMLFLNEIPDIIHAHITYPGGYIGAKLGAYINTKMKSTTLVIALRIMLIVVGIKLIWEGVQALI